MRAIKVIEPGNGIIFFFHVQKKKLNKVSQRKSFDFVDLKMASK